MKCKDQIEANFRHLCVIWYRLLRRKDKPYPKPMNMAYRRYDAIVKKYQKAFYKISAAKTKSK